MEVLKQASGIQAAGFKNGNFTLSDMNMKLGGMQTPGIGVGNLGVGIGAGGPGNGTPFDVFAPEKEFFLQNEVRSVDLSEEERILMSLQAQEVDALRVISRIPIGTELYRFKMEQFKVRYS